MTDPRHRDTITLISLDKFGHDGAMNTQTEVGAFYWTVLAQKHQVG
jgi:hypothetical protein